MVNNSAEAGGSDDLLSRTLLTPTPRGFLARSVDLERGSLSIGSDTVSGSGVPPPSVHHYFGYIPTR